MSPLTSAERRFGASMLLIAAISLPLGAALCLGAPAQWALMGPGRLTVAGCAALAGLDPRAHRPFALPAGLGLVTGGVIAMVQGWWTAAILDTALGLLALFAVAAARRSVQGAWLRGGPPG